MRELATAPEELFWYWIAERHSIYLKKQAGLPKPWTTDVILRDYKFTNPFRENDKGTVWLRENFLEPHRNDDLGLVAFNIAWYRMFNLIATGELLGWQTDWNVDLINLELDTAKDRGEKVFTGAHMIIGEWGRPKSDSIVDVCAELFHMCLEAGALEECCKKDNSLQVVFDGLLQVKYVGKFLAYEIVTDMRHTRLLENAKDIMTWANPGPGAKRGLRRLGLPWQPDTMAIESMQLLLSHAPSLLRVPGQTEFYPQFEMRDIEHSLCEFDKYARVKFGEGRPRSRYPGAA